jgi:phosphonate transport system ATP-binding protein
MLTIEGLVAGYPGCSTPVLQGLSLSVAAGERVAVIGASGAGKTTLFRAIGGFVPAADGRIVAAGFEVRGAKGRSLRALRRNVAVISQHHDLVEQLRVHQNVMAGALGRWSTLRALRFLLFPLRSELDEARAALERVGIGETLSARTGDLSGGQRQRVAIARALVQRPMMLLADEPVASLDPELADRIVALLCRLAREEGIGLLCSLHGHDLAYRYFDRVVEIESGATAWRGGPDAGASDAA